MRNKIQISESEVKRILELHKNRIDQERNTLKEQYSDPGQSGGRIAAGAAAGAGTGALIGLVGGPIGVGVGAVIGTGIGALAGWMTTGGGYSDRVFQILKFCNAHRRELGKTVNDDERIRDIADNINSAVTGLGTEEVLIARNLRNLKSIPDLCRLNDIYAERFNERLFQALDGEFDLDGEWGDFVWRPISELAKNTKKRTIEGVKENAKKCGWGSDVKGYKNSGWRCPKDKNVTPGPTPEPGPTPSPGPGPIPGGGGYELDYQQIMDTIKKKCVSQGGGGSTEPSLDWNAVGPGAEVDTTVSKESMNKLFND